MPAPTAVRIACRSLDYRLRILSPFVPSNNMIEIPAKRTPRQPRSFRRVVRRLGRRGVRADVARDAGVHRGARRATRPTRSGSPSIRRCTRSASPARREHLPRVDERHPGREDRPRRPDHLSRPRPGRRLSAARHAAQRGLAVRPLVRLHRAGRDRLARRTTASPASGRVDAPGVYVGERQDRRARAARHATAAATTASRSTSTWTSRPFARSTPAAIPGSRSPGARPRHRRTASTPSASKLAPHLLRSCSR